MTLEAEGDKPTRISLAQFMVKDLSLSTIQEVYVGNKRHERVPLCRFGRNVHSVICKPLELADRAMNLVV